MFPASFTVPECLRAARDTAKPSKLRENKKLPAITAVVTFQYDAVSFPDGDKPEELGPLPG